MVVRWSELDTLPPSCRRQSRAATTRRLGAVRANEPQLRHLRVRERVCDGGERLLGPVRLAPTPSARASRQRPARQAPNRAPPPRIAPVIVPKDVTLAEIFVDLAVGRRLLVRRERRLVRRDNAACATASGSCQHARTYRYYSRRNRRRTAYQLSRLSSQSHAWIAFDNLGARARAGGPGWCLLVHGAPAAAVIATRGSGAGGPRGPR